MLRPAILATTLLPSLANATETNILTCKVGSKQLSLSIRDDNITYSFGPKGNPELVLKEPVAIVDFKPWNGWGSTDTNTVTFANNAYTYTVVSATSYGNYRDGIHYHDVSIWVERDGKEVAILQCKDQTEGDPLDHLREAKTAIGQCWDRELEQWSENCAD
jgi:hypothetical protein